MAEDYWFWKHRPINDQRRDWKYGGSDWIEDYWKSIQHPHRQLIIDEIQKILPIGSLLELGCNCGPNLYKIKEEFPQFNIQMAGVDINEDAINAGKVLLPDVEFYVNGIDEELPFANSSFDVVLTDAALMYVDPLHISVTMDEICRIANKAVILVEWFSESEMGNIRKYHWARDYGNLLVNREMVVSAKKITKDEWPSKNWYTHGCVFVGKFKTKKYWTLQSFVKTRIKTLV